MKTERLESKMRNYRKYAKLLCRDIGYGRAEADAYFQGGFCLRRDGRVVAVAKYRLDPNEPGIIFWTEAEKEGVAKSEPEPNQMAAKAHKPPIP